jgi:spermidine synthase
VKKVITSGEQKLLLFSVFFLSLCGIIYELVLGSLATYLLGNPVQQYSITIGFFLSSMGLGSYLSRYFTRNLLALFVRVEITLGLVGGLSVVLLTTLFSISPSFYALHIFTLVAIGTLVGLEIPLMTRILKEYGSLKEILSNVLSLDYLGGLAGSLLFPLILFPLAGRFLTSLVIGLLNISVAMIIILRMDYARRKVVDGILTSAAFILLLVLAFQSEAITASLEKRIYQEDVIFSKRTKYQEMVLTRSGNDFRLYLDGALQFSTYDEYRYHEMLVHPVMQAAGRVSDVLVLGGGDGMAVREVLKYPSVRHVTLVELDREMVLLAKNNSTLRMVNNGSLSDERVTVKVEDAYNYLKSTGIRYDVVIADFPDPHDETIAKLYSREFYTMVKRVLREKGVFVTQSTSPLFARKAFWGIHNTMAAIFPGVTPYHIYIPTFGDWGFNMTIPATKKLSGSAPAHFYTSALFSVSKEFPSDSSFIQTGITTFNFPRVYQYYLQGWKHAVE